MPRKTSSNSHRYRRRKAVEGHVGGHDVPRARLDRGLERRKDNVPHFGVRQVDLVIVAAAKGITITGKLLGTGDEPFGRSELGSLQTADLGRGDSGTEHRVLTGALDHSAPPRVTGNVDHRGEGPVPTARASRAATA